MIKMKLPLLLVLITMLFSGCSNMKINAFGIDINEMRNTAKAGDYGKLILGGIASVATHTAGHYIAAELSNTRLIQKGIYEMINYNYSHPSNNSKRWINRSGFLLQFLVNTTLIEFAKDSYFTKGYTIATTIELGGYKIFLPSNVGDFVAIDRNGGSGNLEYGLFGLWGAYNFYRISVLPINTTKRGK